MHELHFGESNFKNFPMEACPRTPLEVCASDTDGTSLPAVPLHPVLSNAIENPISILRDLFYG